MASSDVVATKYVPYESPLGCITFGIWVLKMWTFHYDSPSWASGYRHAVSKSFVLPLDTDGFYFIARGWHSGSLKLECSPQLQGSVQVEVRVACHQLRALNTARAHKLEEKNKHGVGVETPSFVQKEEDCAYFEVVFTFPAACTDEPLRIKSFDAAMDNLSCVIGDLSGKVIFDDLNINTYNGDISAKSVAFKKSSLVSRKVHHQGPLLRYGSSPPSPPTLKRGLVGDPVSKGGERPMQLFQGGECDSRRRVRPKRARTSNVKHGSAEMDDLRGC
ncbi:hypothetical protein F5I97DRAFT_978423 [Phlebopus sp. FC_14]|nr:hypothetical protein F5I97DRAFT_978423 [Phlebopus sp. FC_14]